MKHLSIILQARTGSTRLPGKVTRPFFGDKSMLEIILDKLCHSFPQSPICLATTTNQEDDVLPDIAGRFNASCYRGSEDDVLGRFIGAAETFHAGAVVRVCADNPFLDMALLRQLIEFHQSEMCDYASFEVAPGMPAIKSHFGFFAELALLDALKKAARQTNEPVYREHVTNYIYTHPSQFEVRYVKAPAQIYGRTDIRLTIDNANDFRLAQQIYSDTVNKSLNSLELIAYLDQHPAYLQAMKTEIERNRK